MLAGPLSSFYTFFIYLILPVFSIGFVTRFIRFFMWPLFFLPHSKCLCTLLIVSFKHSCFLCCSTSSFCVSAVSAKNSSSFVMFFTSVLMFITYQNYHDMRNNIDIRLIFIQETIICKKSLFFSGPKIWSKIGPCIKNIRTLRSFMHAIKKKIFLHLQS